MLGLFAPIASMAGWEAAAIKRRAVRLAVVWGLVGLLALIAFGFLLVAAYAALSQSVGPVMAALIIAGAALVIALAVFLTWYVMEAGEKRRREEKRHDAEIAAVVATAAISALPLLAPLLKRGGLPLGAAAIAGWSLYNASRKRHHDDDAPEPR